MKTEEMWQRLQNGETYELIGGFAGCHPQTVKNRLAREGYPVRIERGKNRKHNTSVKLTKAQHEYITNKGDITTVARQILADAIAAGFKPTITEKSTKAVAIYTDDEMYGWLSQFPSKADAFRQCLVRAMEIDERNDSSRFSQGDRVRIISSGRQGRVMPPNKDEDVEGKVRVLVAGPAAVEFVPPSNLELLEKGVLSGEGRPDSQHSQPSDCEREEMESWTVVI